MQSFKIRYVSSGLHQMNRKVLILVYDIDPGDIERMSHLRQDSPMVKEATTRSCKVAIDLVSN